MPEPTVQRISDAPATARGDAAARAGSLEERTTVEVLERELARAYRIERALREVGLALSAEHDRDKVLRIVVDRTIEALEAERATLYLIEESNRDDPSVHAASPTRRLVSKVIEGGAVTRIVLELGQGIAGDVARTGVVSNVRDAYRDARFSRVWDERTGFRTRAVLCVPLRNQHDEVVGVLQVLNKRSSVPLHSVASSGLEGDRRIDGTHAAFFDDDDVALLGALAAQAAVRIEQAAMVESLKQSNNELTETRESLVRKVQDLNLLFAIERATSHATTREELVAAVLPEVARAAGGHTAYVVLADDDGDLQLFHLGNEAIAVLSTIDSWAPPSRGARISTPSVAFSSPRLQRIRIKRGEGLASAALETAATVCVDDLARDSRRHRRVEGLLFCDGQDDHAPCAVVPMLDELDRPFGALAVVRASGDAPFDADALALVHLVALNVSNGFQLQLARTTRARHDRLSTIGSLLSGVMHDLKTPMMIISGNVQMMSTAEDAATRAECAAAVVRQFEHIAAMQKEVLDFARGERTILVRRVYLATFLAEIEAQLRKEIERRRVPIELIVDVHDRGVARFDENKLTRAIHNLARNAIEAMGLGGGTLTISAYREPWRDGEALVIDVSDSGPGLPAEVQEHLFQSFVSSGKPSGTGLGLAIVKKIAEDHGGSIEASSSSTGARFTLRLPQRAEPSRSRPPLGDGSLVSPPLPPVVTAGASALMLPGARRPK